MKWRSEVDEYLPVFKAENKNKMRKDNQLYEIEIREVDKEKKRIKIHYKGFREDRDEWRDYGSLFDLEWFHTVSSPSAPQFHYSKFRIDISVLFSIHSTTLPVMFLLPLLARLWVVCSTEIFLKTFRIRLWTTTSLTPDSSKMYFTTATMAHS